MLNSIYLEKYILNIYKRFKIATLSKEETIKCLKIYGNIIVINIIVTFSVKDTPVRQLQMIRRFRGIKLGQKK